MQATYKSVSDLAEALRPAAAAHARHEQEIGHAGRSGQASPGACT